ncbi:DNA methyltransferase [Psychrobacter sp. NPDC078511]|uniref:DNA methyltransferase n=1 Tax=unclassified Psychrobacter TaxID=196806 RepID=UPI003CFBCB67
MYIFCKNKQAFKQADYFYRKKENAEKMLSFVQSLVRKHGLKNDDVRSKYRKWVNDSKNKLSGGEKAYNLIDNQGEVYRIVSMAAPDKPETRSHKPLIHPITKKNCPVPEKGWRYTDKSLQQLLDKELIVFGKDESTQPGRKYLLRQNMSENVPSLIYYGGSDNALNLPFDNPKPIYIANRLIDSVTKEEDIILDFFAGSSTTAHAVMQLNAEDGGNRKFVMVQINENTDEKSEAYKAGYFTISDLSKERIRRAGQKVLTDNHGKEGIENLDIGFRVLKIDSTNMKDVYYTPDNYEQAALDNLESHIKEDRTGEDLLFQVMLDWGVPLSLPIEVKEIQGSSVYYVGIDSLVACFDILNTDLIDEISKDKPLKFVSSELAIAHDQDKTNIKARFAQLSPDTQVKFI